MTDIQPDIGFTPTIDRHLFVRQFLRNLSADSNAVAQIVAAVREVFFEAGTVIYREGETADHIYVLASGAVTLSTDGAEPWNFGPGSVFGIMDAELSRPHSRTALVVKESRALIVSTEDWFDIVEDNFELSRGRIVANATGLVERGLGVHGGFQAFEGQPVPATNRALNRFERMLLLRHCPLFETAGVQPLITLARLARVRSFSAGDVVFRQGASINSLLIVAEGAVELTRDDPAIQAMFGPESLVGAYSAMAALRPADASAAVDSLLLEIDAEDLYDVTEDHFDLLRSILAYLAHERERLQRLDAPQDY